MPARKTPPESEIGSTQDTQKEKKRRLRGACDKCRLKKTKCDSAAMPGNVCTNCIVANLRCTHDLPNHRKKKEMQQGGSAYIHCLETRIKKLEGYIQKMHPGEDIDRLISTMPPFEDYQVTRHLLTSDLKTSIQHSSFPTVGETVSTPSEYSEESEPEDLSHVALAEDLKKLHTLATANRYFGQSSAFMFLKNVNTIRSQITGENFTGPDPRKYRRNIYWDVRPWEMAFVTSSETPYVFPDDDLLQNLVSLYFEKSNSLLPVLHKPSFEKSLSAGQHQWDPSFGMIVLLVCAIGARYSQDPRVSVPNDESGLSSGWQYFSQVPIHRKMMLYRTTIYDLQYYCLAPIYLLGTTIPHAGWLLVGMGLRFALEKGAHRRTGSSQTPSADNELQKRAFWSLVCLDRVGSSFFGRPLGFPDETIDVEYPVECDDEYWDAEEPFQQPAGKPCSITAFVQFIKLCEILGYAIRSLYAEKKSKFLPSFVGTGWEEKIIAELDSSMNKWKNSLPNYLHWDPERQDSNHFHQSVNLHSMYFYTQIQIHRSSLLKKSPLMFSSLAMCANAARCCARILEAGMTRGLRILPNTLVSAFTAGVVIILGLWGGSSLGYISNPEEDTENLHRCANILKGSERRWHCAGRLCDMLNEAGSMTEYQPTQSKRRRDTNDADDLYQPSNPSTEIFEQEPQPFIKDNSAIFENPLPMRGWDLQRLLLSEMGYLPGNFMEGIENISSIHGYEPEYPTSELASTTTGVPSSNPVNNIFEVWHGLPNTSQWPIEEWDAYLASMSQS